MMDSHNDSTGFAAAAAVHTSSPFSFHAHLWARRRPARPAGCQMELTRSQPALSLLSPVALEGKPSSEAKAASPRQIPLLCHSAGTGVFVSVRRSSSASVLARCWTFITSQIWSRPARPAPKDYTVCLTEHLLIPLVNRGGNVESICITKRLLLPSQFLFIYFCGVVAVGAWTMENCGSICVLLSTLSC